MKTLPLALLLFSFSLGSSSLRTSRVDAQAATAAHLALAAPAQPQARKGGKWYFAETGHAVYCYGPVKLVPQDQGGLQRVATVCQGNQPLVPLRD